MRALVVATQSPVDDRRVLRRTEELLAVLGYEVGEVDGRSTPETEQAARLFQRRAGLSETGSPSAELLSKLAEAVRSAGPIAGEPRRSVAAAGQTFASRLAVNGAAASEFAVPLLEIGRDLPWRPDLDVHQAARLAREQFARGFRRSARDPGEGARQEPQRRTSLQGRLQPLLAAPSTRRDRRGPRGRRRPRGGRGGPRRAGRLPPGLRRSETRGLLGLDTYRPQVLLAKYACLAGTRPDAAATVLPELVSSVAQSEIALELGREAARRGLVPAARALLESAAAHRVQEAPPRTSADVEEDRGRGVPFPEVVARRDAFLSEAAGVLADVGDVTAARSAVTAISRADFRDLGLRTLARAFSRSRQYGEAVDTLRAIEGRIAAGEAMGDVVERTAENGDLELTRRLVDGWTSSFCPEQRGEVKRAVSALAAAYARKGEPAQAEAVLGWLRRYCLGLPPHERPAWEEAVAEATLASVFSGRLDDARKLLALFESAEPSELAQLCRARTLAALARALAERGAGGAKEALEEAAGALTSFRWGSFGWGRWNASAAVGAAAAASEKLLSVEEERALFGKACAASPVRGPAAGDQLSDFTAGYASDDLVSPQPGAGQKRWHGNKILVQNDTGSAVRLFTVPDLDRRFGLEGK